TALVRINGHKFFAPYCSFSLTPMAVHFAIKPFGTAPSFPRGASSKNPTGAENATPLSLGGAVYGFATGWSSYAADYNVYQPEETPAHRVFLLTFMGVAIPCTVLEILGMALTTAYKGLGGGELLAAAAKPLGSFGTFLLLL